MSLLRIFAVMLVAFTFTFVGCKKDTGQTPGETTGVEKETPDNTDDALEDGSGAPAEQPDDAEGDADADAEGDADAGAEGDADAGAEGDDAAEADETPAKKDGE